MAKIKLNKSKFGTLNLLDGIKAAALTAIIAVLTTLQQAIQAGDINWELLGNVAISAFLGYLIKNVFENERGTFGK